jgi:hypothetical protein
MKPPVHDDEDFLPEPRNLRMLRRLVTLLTATIIVGLAVVAGAMVLRLVRDPAPAPVPPDAAAAERLVVPAGETITAAGAAPGALMLVTRDADGAERLRLYDAATGALTRVVAIARQ